MAGDALSRARERSRISWQPYVYFRQRPFRGETITIDAEGLRSTWHRAEVHPVEKDAKPPIKILMLGGSSLWGFGRVTTLRSPR